MFTAKHFVIGSRMMRALFPENERIDRRCKHTADYDVLVGVEPTDDLKTYFKQLYGSKTELHYIPPFWNFMVTWQNLPEQHVQILRDGLFTLKASHVSFDKVHKAKTFYDLFLLSSEANCKINEPLFYELHSHWTKKFGEKWRADFTKESSDFFDDAVSRENVHDELHRSVAYYHQPAFKFLQEPGQTTVWVSPEKWAETTEHIRQRVVIEEAQTLALERFILPGKMKSRDIAYVKMIEGLIDRLAPLWMTVYILDNFAFFINFKEEYGSKSN